MTTGAADLLLQDPSRGGPGGEREPGGLGFDGQELDPLLDAGEGSAARSPWRLFWARLRGDRVALASLGFIVLLVVVALAAPLVVQLAGVPGPYVQNPGALDAFGSPTGPSAAHPFGVDQLGRDVFARVVYGTRVSLEVGVIGTAIATVSAPSWVCSPASTAASPTRCSRARSTSCSAFRCCSSASGWEPRAACAAACEGRSSPAPPRLSRSSRCSTGPTSRASCAARCSPCASSEFVEAARSLGASGARIVFREILPNLTAPLIVYASLLIPANILLEAALSFLGVGVRAPTASWGQMLADATPIFNTAWWYMLFPGLALLLTVLAFNLLGDGLQDALNPRAGRR